MPARRYQPSSRPYTGRLIEPEYGPDDIVRRVQDKGWFSFKGHEFKVSKAFASQRIALRPTAEDGVLDVVFVAQRISQVNLRDALGERNPSTKPPNRRDPCPTTTQARPIPPPARGSRRHFRRAAHRDG